MSFRFSEEEVYLFGMALALVVSPFAGIPYFKMALKRYWRDKRNNSLNDMAGVTLFGLLFGALSFYILKPLFHFPSVLWLFIIGTCVEVVAVYFYLKPLNRTLIEENIHSFSEEEAAASVRKRDVPVYYQIICIFLLNGLLALGCLGFLSWFMPDVAEIQDGPGGSSYEYKVCDYYVFPFEKGLKPGGSYIDNLTRDTIYRLVVDYGFLGEELYNYYTVQGKYPPHSFCRMPVRTVHVMDTIAPIMLPSHGRMGRYRTQRVYLTDYMHMCDFKSANLIQFGLKGNKWVDTIKETRNTIIRESNKEYRAYKVINPYPYPRLIPDSLRKVKTRKTKISTKT